MCFTFYRSLLFNPQTLIPPLHANRNSELTSEMTAVHLMGSYCSERAVESGRFIGEVTRGAYRSLQEFTGVYRSLQKLTEVYRNLQIFTGVYSSLQKFTEVYMTCLQAFTDLPISPIMDIAYR